MPCFFLFFFSGQTEGLADSGRENIIDRYSSWADMSLSIYPLINGFCVASRYPSLWNIYSRTYQGTDGRLKQSVEFASRPKAGSSTINTIMAGQATTTVSNTVTKCDIVIFHHNILIKLSYCHKFHDIKGRFLPSTLPCEGAWLLCSKIRPPPPPPP